MTNLFVIAVPPFQKQNYETRSSALRDFVA